MRSFPSVILVSDDTSFLSSADAMLRSERISHPHTLSGNQELLTTVARTGASLIVIDLATPHVSGTDVLSAIRGDFPEIPVIVVSRRTEAEAVVACMKAGAVDYLVKPVAKDRFLSSIRSAITSREPGDRMRPDRESGHTISPDKGLATHGIITKNSKMRTLFRYATALAPSRQPVLITGETGTGKELFARAVHAVSGCRGEFVAVNVAGLDDAMFSDTLFGHKRGAYTGAERAREGMIANASSGTLFLDEIGELTEASQVKLLRLLESKEYYPLGSDTPRKTDARIICATHRNLGGLAAEGKFRMDVYYRVSIHQIHVPPLRERLDDVPLLVSVFLDEASRLAQRKRATPPSELFTLLSTYDFPGNVRELRTLVVDAVMRNRSGILSLDRFKETVGERVQARSGSSLFSATGDETPPVTLGGRFPTMREVEAYLVDEALKRARNNQGIAALLLGISRRTLNKRLSRKRNPPAKYSTS